MKWQLMKRQVGGGKERGMEGGREGGVDRLGPAPE